MAMLNIQTVADKMPNRMLDRKPDGMSEYICQKEYQFECQNMCQIEYLAGSLEYVVFVFKKGEVHPMCTIVLFLQHISVNGIYDDSSNDDPQSYVTFPLPFPFPDAYA